MGSDIRYKFVGKEGEYVIGIPATDLTEDAYKALTDEQKDILRAHLKTDEPLYEKAEKPAAKQPKVTEE